MDLHYFANMLQTASCKKNISSFAAKLQRLNISTLPMGAYSRRYLDHLVFHNIYYLTIYADLLDNVLKYSTKNTGEICLVDYGAGNGLLAMFAKYCGFKKVFVCDRDAEFVEAARMTASALDIIPDEFITGNITTLRSDFSGQPIDAIAGTDVIEHIYNLEEFFGEISAINKDMVTVFSTASNPANIIKTRKLKKLQIKDEQEGSDPGDFVLAGAEKHEAFLVIREKILRKNFPQLSADKYSLLAKATRGLNEADIMKAGLKFLQTGQMPKPDDQSTNTCNPVTGSWTERILTIKQYEDIYIKNGFALKIKNGFYNSSTPGLKKFVNKTLNVLIKLTGKNTAPFITLIGFRAT